MSAQELVVGSFEIVGSSSYRFLELETGLLIRDLGGVKGSSIAASTTRQASRIGSVGFFLGFFFGMPYHAIFR